MSNLVLVLSSGVAQLPAAIITKAFVPILIIGAAGGIIIGGTIHGSR